jgi:hypothetical protein
MTLLRSLFALALVWAAAQPLFAQTQESIRPSDRKTLFQWPRGGFQPETDDAEPEPDRITTDRPDFTESSTTVGLGSLQLEAGYTLESDDDGATLRRNHSWGEPLFRVGVCAQWMEVRLSTPPVTQTVASGGVDQTESGFEDLYLGFKFALTEQVDCLPESAVITQMTVPSGDDALTENATLPGVNYLYSWSLTEEWSLAGSTQFNRASDPIGKEYTEWAQSVALGRSLTENLGAYSECFGLMPSGAITVNPEYYFNGGFTYLLGDNVQWDIRAGVGLNEAANDYFVGTGLSLRYRRFLPGR